MYPFGFLFLFILSNTSGWDFPFFGLLLLIFKMMFSEAFVTLATNDDCTLGALVLAQSIQEVRTNRKLIVLASQGFNQTTSALAQPSLN